MQFNGLQVIPLAMPHTAGTTVKTAAAVKTSAALKSATGVKTSATKAATHRHGVR